MIVNDGSYEYVCAYETLEGRQKTKMTESVKVKLRIVTIELFVKKLCDKSIYRLINRISPIYDLMYVILILFT